MAAALRRAPSADPCTDLAAALPGLDPALRLCIARPRGDPRADRAGEASSSAASATWNHMLDTWQKWGCDMWEETEEETENMLLGGFL